MKKEKVNVFDFDACIQNLSKQRLGLVQRHKLIYFAFRTYFMRMGAPPFKSTIEAWPLGPVFVELQEHQSRKGDAGKLNELMLSCCEDTVRCCGHLSGRELIRLSHQVLGEWQRARLFVKTGQRGPEMTTRSIRAFFNNGYFIRFFA